MVCSRVMPRNRLLKGVSAAAAVAPLGAAPAAVGLNLVREDGDAGGVPARRRRRRAVSSLVGAPVRTAAAPLAGLIRVETLATPFCGLGAGHRPLLVDVLQQSQANLGISNFLAMDGVHIPRLIQRVHEGTRVILRCKMKLRA
jgi:hypothetical protein